MFRCKKLLSAVLVSLFLFTIQSATVDAFEGQPEYYGVFNVQYTQPQADAGDDQIAVINDAVILNGLNSSDANGDPLTYTWSLDSVPVGSAASILEPFEGSATFTPDLIGDYQVSLVVNDGNDDSSPAVVTVSVFKALRPAARKMIANIIADIKFLRGFSPEVFRSTKKVKRKKRATKLIKKLRAISKLIKKKKIKKARNKLLLLLERVDGCTLRGTPDLIDSGYKVDFIIDCAAQKEIYDSIVDTIEMLTEGIRYYADADGDGYGNLLVSQKATIQPSGYVTDNSDCDDSDALEQPGQIWYADTDNDGYSDGTYTSSCIRPTGYKVSAELTATSGDCDDTANTIYPGAVELCDGLDNNCDYQIDEVCAANEDVYFDDFDLGWGSWWASNGVWEVGTPDPAAGPGSAYSDTECAGTVLDGNYPGTNSNLVSPSVILPDIVAGEEIQLRFWHWFSFGTSVHGNDNGRVYIQEETAPGVWSSATQLTAYAGSSGGVWTRPMVDISEYAGKKVRILFGLVRGSGFTPVKAGWYIDDVAIDVVSVESALPYFDDFELGLGDWWAHNGTWQVDADPAAGPSSAYSGSQCAGTVLDGNYPGTNSSLRSPSITLSAISAGEEIQLRFWHWFSFGTSVHGNDNGRVYIQEETAPGVWSSATQLTAYAGSSGGVWTRPMVDISEYAGKKVRILFGLVRGSGFTPVRAGWYIDDVAIDVY